MNVPGWAVVALALALAAPLALSAPAGLPAQPETAARNPSPQAPAATDIAVIPPDVPEIFHPVLAHLTAADWENAVRETARVALPPGHGIVARYAPGIGLDVLPEPSPLLGTNLPWTPMAGATAGCVAVPGELPAGWVASGTGACEPAVEAREWFQSAPQEMVFATFGEGLGGVNAVNFPEPWEQDRHGIFLLWCILPPVGSAGVATLLFHPDAICETIGIGLPLEAYDEWTGYLYTHDGLGPHQTASVVSWLL